MNATDDLKAFKQVKLSQANIKYSMNKAILTNLSKCTFLNTETFYGVAIFTRYFANCRQGFFHIAIIFCGTHMAPTFSI